MCLYTNTIITSKCVNDIGNLTELVVQPLYIAGRATLQVYSFWSYFVVNLVADVLFLNNQNIFEACLVGS